MNGKLSLSSSEGLIEMIHAESRAGVAAGYSLYREKLYDALEGVRKDLTFALASLNAQIDYPEEGLEELTDGEITSFLTSAIQKLSALSETYQTGSFVKNGVKVALLGKPNAGKSSLLNRLIGRERAIVTEIAGTTRDVVEGETEISGVRFLFSDTAGIRDTQDTVERMGVTLSKKVASQADIAIFLTDGSWQAEDETL
ncbi:MAG: 50S ribosome-binding GTPase, partial [Clostridia bacterium]|nr:50S ribosome-binding GTPase [Clostridia bacterium]